ncbi:cytosine-5--methyltransferase NCL1 [Amniculicola lignicola CBS 123094]|uniref:Cytosine-5--methyltransferase NCL1 n=1 Tax=Amniculicola lignicola CBS 123094 TaxID=1392246 RepID=A0A6A5W6C7_9PLEO|nr:cytosine-5--methyltransferase NCL1 [Amniculicola lignicola CBS 123094]
MWKALRSDLPNSFRFTGTKSDALAVREIFKQRYIPAITALEFEGQPVQPPQAVAAFPDELVWDMKTHKKIIRRHKPFAEFQKFLVAETTSGNISRQEVVSMIPPHFLDVRPGMVVLDMCAAPGSKTAQLAEMIHGDEEERVQKAARNDTSAIEGDYSDDGRSTGLLIANDSDYKRAGMLVHQVKRLNFPNLIVTQHDASIFPSIELPSAEDEKNQYLKFDRVLADVPCSGDGTARKNPNVWQKWTPKDALGLHNLQLRIACRGLQLLKKGGRLVYSTCSMNPVENEAVVAAAIQACGGPSKIRLVDASGYLPNLKRKPGLNTWKVPDTSFVDGQKTIHLFNTWEKFQQAKEKCAAEEPNRNFSSKMSASAFPPISTTEDERIPLEHCVRVYPHLQDTGGFFIAVLEKMDDIKTAKAKGDPASTEQQQNGGSGKRKFEDAEDSKGSKRPKTASPEFANETVEEMALPADSVETQVADSALNASAKEADVRPTANPPAPISKPPSKVKEVQASQKEYFEYLPKDDSTISNILSFFGIAERFPRDRFMVKNKEGLSLNKIYYTSELARVVLQQNKERGMKFVHCGVVMFVSHKIKDSDQIKAPWRLQFEGIKILEPWASKRIVQCTSKDTLYKLLTEMFPKLPKDGSHGLGEVGDALMKLDPGCCFLKIEEKAGEDGFPFGMVLPIWRHPGSLNLMVAKDDRKAMLLRLYNELEPVIKDHVAEKMRKERDVAMAAEARDVVDMGNDDEGGVQLETENMDVAMEE